MFYKKKSISTIVSLRITINGNVKIICYYCNDVVPRCLRYISQNDYITFSTLHIPMKEQNNITDEKNRRDSVEFEISVSIRTQDTTYDYNDEFWYSI